MKRISPGTVTIGVLAVVFGLVAAYAARHMLSREPVAIKAPAGPKMASVVVPRINLAKYTRIRNQDVDVIQIPADIVPEGVVQLKNRALFRLVKSTMLAGQPMMEKNLFGVGEVPMLSDQLPPGYRAVTLSVDANSALNGMIQPESCVDISLTVNNDRPEIGGLATLTLMRGVKILATSQSRFRSSEDLPADLQNVTVAVTPEEANKLILAQRYGSLSVTLRSTVDGKPPAEDGELAASNEENDLVNPFDLLGISPLIPTPEPEAAPVKTAQVWRAGVMHTITFQGDQIQESQNATAVTHGREPTETPIDTTRAKATDTARQPKGSNQPTPAQPIRYRRETTSNVIAIPVEISN